MTCSPTVKKTTTNNKYTAEKDKICTASGGMRSNLAPLQLVLYTSTDNEHEKQARVRAHGAGTSQRERPHNSISLSAQRRCSELRSCTRSK